MILSIIGRDILITVLRYLAIRKGVEVKTTRLGKVKTAFQMLSIFLILLILIMRSYNQEIAVTYEHGRRQGKKNIVTAYEMLRKGIHILPQKHINPHEKKKVFASSLPYFLMLITTIFTIISGIRYLLTNYEALLPPYYIFKPRKLE